MKKTRDIHHFWLFPKQPRIYQLFLSIFYHFFIIFYHFPRKQRKMNKNYQKMMKIDKKLIKKWKKTRDIHHFWLFPKKPRIYQFFINFLIMFLSFFNHFPRKQRKMNKNYQKMMKNDKKLIKKWKKLETFTIFDCFRSSPEFINFLSIFFQQHFCVSFF